MKSSVGTIQVYTGDGKGKTTASLGLAARALGHGQKVCMIQFMKGSAKYGEIKFAKKTRLLWLERRHVKFVKKTRYL